MHKASLSLSGLRPPHHAMFVRHGIAEPTVTVTVTVTVNVTDRYLVLSGSDICLGCSDRALPAVQRTHGVVGLGLLTLFDSIPEREVKNTGPLDTDHNKDTSDFVVRRRLSHAAVRRGPG